MIFINEESELKYQVKSVLLGSAEICNIPSEAISVYSTGMVQPERNSYGVVCPINIKKSEPFRGRDAARCRRRSLGENARQAEVRLPLATLT